MMHLKLKHSLLIVLCTIFFTATNTQEVNACSGGAPLTVAGLINGSDYVVKAQVTEVNDLGQNVILQVEAYLAGGQGPEYLLWTRNDPVFVEYILAGRSTGGDCLGLSPSLYPAQTTYLFLHRNDNGSYKVVRTLFNADDYTFPTPDSTVELFLTGGFKNGNTVYEDFAEKGSGQQVNEQEFLAIIAEQSGEMPLPPHHDQPYPLKAPLQITTQSGSQYLFPVDGEPLIELTDEIRLEQQQDYPLWSYGFSDAGRCEIKDCRSTSPDGLNIAVQTDQDTITLTQGQEVTGQASLFSSHSDTIAVWDKCKLTVYTLGYPRLFEEWFEVEELNHRLLNGENNCTSLQRLAAWNPDGRLLAYSDAQGLWFWDVFDLNVEPQLLISESSDDIPFARNFSPMGRYLSVTQGSENYILDIFSGHMLPDGLISPNDRLLLKFDTSADVFDVEICAIVPYSCQPVSYMFISALDENSEATGLLYDGLHQISSVQWQDGSEFVVQVCAPDDPDLCSIFRWFPYFFGWERSMMYHRVIGFDYDPLNHNLAVVVDGTHITINDTTYDLSDMLDGDIIHIQWLPSLFYRS